jgi:hypothetical protein
MNRDKNRVRVKKGLKMMKRVRGCKDLTVYEA